MIRRQIAIFLVVGTLTVLVDFLCYRALTHWTGLNVDLAKAAGFLAGTVFSYFANRFLTFGAVVPRPGSVLRFAALYLGTLAVNVLVNAAVLNLLQDRAGRIQIAFLCATGFSTVLNFLGMKMFVFKNTGTSEV